MTLQAEIQEADVFPEDLMWVRFTHVKLSADPDNFETLPFYTKVIRPFLAENDGLVCWLRGNTGGIRGAYLMFHRNLYPSIVKLLTHPLGKGGFFQPLRISLKEIVEAYKRKQLYVEGRIRFPGFTFGRMPITARPLPSSLQIPNPLIFTLPGCEYRTVIYWEKAYQANPEWLILENVEIREGFEGCETVTRKDQYGIRLGDIQLHTPKKPPLLGPIPETVKKEVEA